MRLLILTDIHGNLPALEAVLQTPQAKSCDLVFSLGDHTGFGPAPRAVQSLLEEKHATMLLGNHEDRFVHTDPVSLQRYSWGILTETIRQMQGMSTDYSVDASLGPIYMIHGIPGATFRLIQGRDVPPVLDALPVDCRLLLTGHNHVPWCVYHRNRLAVNAGSLGMVEDGCGQNAPFLVVDLNGSDFTVSRYTVPYDLRETVKLYLSSGIAYAMPQISRAALLTMRTGASWYILALVEHMKKKAAALGLEPESYEAWHAADESWSWPEAMTSRQFWDKEAKP